jgi:hypothetical protein
VLKQGIKLAASCEKNKVLLHTGAPSSPHASGECSVNDVKMLIGEWNATEERLSDALLVVGCGGSAETSEQELMKAP